MTVQNNAIPAGAMWQSINGNYYRVKPGIGVLFWDSRTAEWVRTSLLDPSDLVNSEYVFIRLASEDLYPPEAHVNKVKEQQGNKYTRTVKGVDLDVYDVLAAWNVTNPALQHLIKKALQCGDRGHKSRTEDLQDILASAKRAVEIG